MLKATLGFSVAAIYALTPAFASAGITVPPSATEGDQYLEVAPNGGGSSVVDSGSGGSAAVPATDALNALGPEGQAAADLANSNRPPQQGKPAPQGKPSRDQKPESQPSLSTEGEGGMGFLFPLLLVVTALAAIAYGMRRRLTPA